MAASDLLTESIHDCAIRTRDSSHLEKSLLNAICAVFSSKKEGVLGCGFSGVQQVESAVFSLPSGRGLMVQVYDVTVCHTLLLALRHLRQVYLRPLLYPPGEDQVRDAQVVDGLCSLGSPTNCSVYTVGQCEPRMEVQAPNSKKHLEDRKLHAKAWALRYVSFPACSRPCTHFPSYALRLRFCTHTRV